MAKSPEQKPKQPEPLSQQEFFSQAKLFTDYINYDWESDTKWKAFVTANPEIMAEERDKE